jgi:hypothetical protein
MRPTENILLDTLRATGEIYGKNVSLAAATMFLADLDHFPPDQVLRALARCRKELRNFPTVADVIARIDDGRPGVEEAWAMLPKSEADSVVWTEEMAEAWGTCRDLLDRDPIAARMTFKEVYSRVVAEAKATSKPVTWTPSLGHDKQGRAGVLLEAVQKLRIPLAEATKLDPSLGGPSPAELELTSGNVAKVLDIVRKALPRPAE